MRAFRPLAAAAVSGHLVLTLLYASFSGADSVAELGPMGNVLGKHARAVVVPGRDIHPKTHIHRCTPQQFVLRNFHTATSTVKVAAIAIHGKNLCLLLPP